MYGWSFKPKHLGFLTLLILLSTSCSFLSGPKEPLTSANLDIAIPSVSPSPSPLPTKPWQAFFKAPPSPSEREQLHRALTELKKATDLPAPSLLNKARYELALGYSNEAENTYRQLLREEPDELSAALELALIFVQKKQNQEAVEQLAEIKDELADSEQVERGFLFRYRYTLALTQLQLGKSLSGHEILCDLIALDKTFTPAYAALASSYLEENKLDAAEFIIKRGLDRAGEDASFYNLFGVLAEQQGLFDKAFYWYDKALALSPSFVPALVNKAILAFKTFDDDSAEKLLQQSLLLQPDQVVAHTALASLYMRKGKDSQAKDLLERAVVLDLHYAPSRYNLGLLYLHRLKDPFEALRLFSEVVQLENDPNSDLSHLAQANLNDIKLSNHLKG